MGLTQTVDHYFIISIFIVTFRTVNTMVSILFLSYCIYRICSEHGIFKTVYQIKAQQDL